jgi:hypothetical protein
MCYQEMIELSQTSVFYWVNANTKNKSIQERGEEISLTWQRFGNVQKFKFF